MQSINSNSSNSSSRHIDGTVKAIAGEDAVVVVLSSSLQCPRCIIVRSISSNST